MRAFFSTSFSQVKTWYRHRFQPYRRIKLADRIGCRVICHDDHSPIEHIVNFTGGSLARRSQPTDELCYPGMSDDLRNLRGYIDEADFLGTPTGVANTLRAAACFEDRMAGYLDSAERHIWRWMTWERPSADETAIASYVADKMDGHFLCLRDRVERDLQAMTDLVDKAPSIEPMIISCSAEANSIYESTEAQAGFLAMVRRTQLARTIGQLWPAASGELLETLTDQIVADIEAALQTQHQRHAIQADAVRRSIKRAYKLFDRLGETKLLGLLVSRQPICLSGADSPFVFRIELRDEPGMGIIYHTAHLGHTVPFILSLETREGEHLANLCAYADETPILDFLLAIKLHVDAGEDRALLSKANWYNFGDRKFVKAFMEQHAPEFVNRIPEPVAGDRSGQSRNDIRPGCYPDGSKIPEWAMHEALPFNEAAHLPYAERRPMQWQPSLWRFGVDLEEVDDEFMLDTREMAPYIPAVRREIGAWFGAAIARWSEIREPLDRLIAISGVKRSDPELIAE